MSGEARTCSRAVRNARRRPGPALPGQAWTAEGVPTAGRRAPERGRPAAPRPRCIRPGCLPPEQRSVRLLTWAALSAARRPRGVGEVTPLGLVSTCPSWRSRLGAGAGSCQHGPGGGSAARSGAGRTRPWGDRRRSPGASFLTFLPPVDAREMVPARTRSRSAWGRGDALSFHRGAPSPTVWPAPELTAASRLSASPALWRFQAQPCFPASVAVLCGRVLRNRAVPCVCSPARLPREFWRNSEGVGVKCSSQCSTPPAREVSFLGGVLAGCPSRNTSSLLEL